ncbi:hypothetical protein ACS0TY_030800 [Phlomoides rotata]
MDSVNVVAAILNSTDGENREYGTNQKNHAETHGAKITRALGNTEFLFQLFLSLNKSGCEEEREKLGRGNRKFGLLYSLYDLQSMAKACKSFIMKWGKSMSLTMTIFWMISTLRMVGNALLLLDVEEGGESVFPAAKGNYSAVPWWNELSECGKGGLSVKPKRGEALLFWSMKPDATLDSSSLHGGCHVIKGNKWSSTKWMRVHEYKA